MAFSYTQNFYACEITSAQYTGGTLSTQVTYASDTGYRTLIGDGSPIIRYPPYISEAFAIDRKINLDPGSSALSAAWGSLMLSNVNNQYSSLVQNWNNDCRPVKIYFAKKTLDTTRRIWIDPDNNQFQPVFVGVQRDWTLSETTLEIPLRDAGYWLDRPLQTSQYSGLGSYSGSASLAGQTYPVCRGGTASHPIKNVTPVLIDPINLVYQYNDTAGTVVALYEGGAQNHTFNSDTTNLYTGTTPSGQYRTDNSRGLFQLGSAAVATITADVTGQFPGVGAVSVPAQIAYYMILNTAGTPSANVDASNFSTAIVNYGYTGGIYFPAGDTSTVADAVNKLLASFHAKLFQSRAGQLGVLALRAPSGSPAINLTTNNTVSVVPQSLPTSVDPPTYRVRVGYLHNYTIQNSGLLGVATATQQQYVAQSDTYVTATSSAVTNAYLRPNDLAPITGNLLVQADAQTVANDVLALWGVRRRLYTVTVPTSVGLGLDLGSLVNIKWPVDNLSSGQLGVIVEESFRSGDSTISFGVLV